MKKFILCLLTGILCLILLPSAVEATYVMDVYLEVEAPYAGREVCYEAWGPPRTECGYYYYEDQPYNMSHYYSGICWYDETAESYLQPGDTFDLGHVYQVAVAVHTYGTGYDFYAVKHEDAVSTYYNTNGHINGEQGVMNILHTSLYRTQEAVVYYTFPACTRPPADISKVEITDIATPHDLDNPMFTASVLGENYSLCTDEYDQRYNIYDGVGWKQHLGNDYYYIMNADDAFERGKVYSVYFLLKSEYPYYFSVSNTEALAVIATVKGYRAEVLPAYNRDPRRYCVVKYTFPACPYNLTTVHNAQLTDIQEPVPGQTPDYTATTGTGFSIIDDSGTCIKNGICWYDYTEKRFMLPTDTFKEGNEYSISMGLVTSEGWMFADDNKGNCLTTVSVNGGTEQSASSISGPNRIYVEYRFPACAKAKVTTVTLTDMVPPVAGEKPDLTVTVAGDGYVLQNKNDVYYTNGVGWYDATEGTMMLDGETFQKGHSYMLEVYLVPDTGYQFSSATVTVNGETAEGYCNPTQMIVYYEFPPAKDASVIITAQPKNAAAPSGSKATVTVKAQGEGLTYKWYYKSKGESKFSLTTAFTGNTYSVQMNASRDGRQVYCVITDQYGCSVTSDVATIYMGNTLAITQQPQSVSAASGATAKVTVKAIGDGLTYKWYYRSKGDTYFSMTTAFSGNTYSVQMNSSRAGRQIYCVITDKYGCSVKTNTVTLNMGTVLSITTQPQNVTAANGATASVTVKATGDGLTYKWYYKNKGDSKFTYTATFTGNTYSVQLNSSRNGRQIYCVITDKYGSTLQTNTVTLTMSSGVKITSQPVSVTVSSGSTAKVTVGATGEGLTYKWYYMNKGESKFTYTATFTGNTYSVQMNASRAGRQIYCVVTDKYGNSVKSNVVTLSMGTTLAITTQPKSVTVASGAAASVTVKATGDGLTYKWYYKNKGNSTFTLTTAFKSNTYSVQMNASRAGRQLYCVITDKYGSVVQTVTVTLNMA